MKKSHVHQYQRTTIGKEYTVYRCVLSGCSHYITPELLPGRECKCYICKKTFVIKKERRILARPHCESCSARPDMKKRVVDPKTSEFLDQLLEEVQYET